MNMKQTSKNIASASKKRSYTLTLLKKGKYNEFIARCLLAMGEKLSKTPLGFLFYRTRFFILGYTLKNIEIKRPLNSIKIRIANPNDINGLNKLLNNRTEYERRFKNNDTCIIAELGKGIIAVNPNPSILSLALIISGQRRYLSVNFYSLPQCVYKS